MNLIKREWLLRAAVVCISIAVALGLAEVALRVLYPRAIAIDPILGHMGTPNTEDLDARGFRNEQALATATIVVLGDSQTHGNNATRAESWPQVLGALASTSVYQMAVGGFGPVQEAYVIDEALTLEPRLIVLGVYLGNDMLDAFRMVYDYEYWSALRDPLFDTALANQSGVNVRAMIQTGYAANSWSLRIYESRLWLRNNIRVYALLGDATRAVREQMGVARTMDEKRAAVEEFAGANPEISFIYDTVPAIRTHMSPAYRAETIDIGQPRTAEGWRIAQGRYDYIIQSVRQRNIPLVVVLIPTKELVYATFMREREETLPDAFVEYVAKEEQLRKMITEYFVTREVPVHQTLPALVHALHDAVPVYGQTLDGHPIAPGYRVIGTSVFEALQKGIVIP